MQERNIENQPDFNPVRRTSVDNWMDGLRSMMNDKVVTKFLGEDAPSSTKGWMPCFSLTLATFLMGVLCVVSLALNIAAMFIPSYITMFLTPWMRVIAFDISLWTVNVKTSHVLGGIVPYIDSPMMEMVSPTKRYNAIHNTCLKRCIENI